MRKILKIDEKWSVEYDESFNDLPVALLRYGESSSYDFTNLEVAMFFRLKEILDVLYAEDT